MADRTIKPDSGNDLVLQNNGGGTKIEIPNSGDIAITGTIGSGTFNGTVGSSSTFNDGHTSANISQFTAKAWVYWDGYTSPVERNSFNCTLTRTGAGSFYITFTNNMSNAYFCVFAQGQVATAYPQTASVTDSSKSASRSGAIYFNENGSLSDPYTAQIVVFGD